MTTPNVNILTYKRFQTPSRGFELCCGGFRATSHTRPRAHDQYTSNTLIGGKGGSGPSSLHNTLEGPTEYVNARWMYIDSYMALNGSCFTVTWTAFKNHLLKVDHGTSNTHNRLYVPFYNV
jgi:hypothetical protein